MATLPPALKPAVKPPVKPPVKQPVKAPVVPDFEADPEGNQDFRKQLEAKQRGVKSASARGNSAKVLAHVLRNR